MPKETRGLLNGIYSFAGQLGTLIFSLVAGYLFDNVGPKFPFYLVGILDLIFAIFIIIMTQFGLFNYYDEIEKKSQEKKSLSKSIHDAKHNPRYSELSKGLAFQTVVDNHSQQDLNKYTLK